MHIFFSGIGGAGIGPLALIAKQAGHEVSGSDKQDSQYITYLKQHGITDINIDQSLANIAKAHGARPIDWYVYSSAVDKENPDAEELQFVRANGIKMSKRDELTNKILEDKKLKLIAIAGTHGKTTTTAMVIWLFKELGIPVSYSVGAKISFGEMGHYDPASEYFVYECDEFDRNFLAFHPYFSLISGVTYDHHEIFPTKDDYKQAFKDFIGQCEWVILWQREAKYLGVEPSPNVMIPSNDDARLNQIKLAGRYNREDAWLAIQGIGELLQQPLDKLVEIMNRFPGLQRRMERIMPGLYSDYAHTPEKIRGAMSVALEMADGKDVVVVYEPLTNRRQHYIMDDYGDCFKGAKKVYWVPSYLAREVSTQWVIPPEELIEHLADPSIAEARERDESLKKTIQKHLGEGAFVVAMAGGGGDSLDEWIRAEFQS